MKPVFTAVRRSAGFLPLGAALLISCDKPETAAPAPASPPPVTAPAGAGTMEAIDNAAGSAAPTVNPVVQAAALDAFKAEIREIKSFMEANQENVDINSGLNNLKELVRRASAVRTDQLPADLAEAYKEMTTALNNLQSTLENMPIPLEMLANGPGKGDKDPAIAAEVDRFRIRMQEHEKASSAAEKKLRQVAEKYGVEALDMSGK